MRYYYIDRVRVFLMMLVIFHHTLIAFGLSGGWYFRSATPLSTEAIMSLMIVTSVNQAFFMSLFFFVSAFFIPMSYDKKGPAKFIKDRLVRLGIPLLVYALVLQPTLSFLISRYYGGAFDTTWLNFVIDKDLHHLETGPMWFVLSLMLFEGIYVLYRCMSNNHLSEKFSDKFPGTGKILLFIIVTGLIAFLIRFVYPVGKNFIGLQFGYFSLYVAMYALGLLAYRKQWLEQLNVKVAKHWFYISLVAIVVLMAKITTSSEPENLGQLSSGGLNSLAFIYAMWEPFVCVGFSYLILASFRKYFNNPNKIIDTLAPCTYGGYFIHPFIVVGMTMTMDMTACHPMVKMLAVIVSSIILCFLITYLLRKIPLVRRVL